VLQIILKRWSLNLCGHLRFNPKEGTQPVLALLDSRGGLTPSDFFGSSSSHCTPNLFTICMPHGTRLLPQAPIAVHNDLPWVRMSTYMKRLWTECKYCSSAELVPWDSVCSHANAHTDAKWCYGGKKKQKQQLLLKS